MHLFVDTVTIPVAAGHGGAGKVSFRREAKTPNGGPDGGNGGKGGNVVFVCDRRVTTFYDIKMKRKFKARDGENGGKNQCDGKNGSDLELHTPLGTLIYNEENDVIADLTEDGERFIALRGGKGGKGNAFFATSTNQAPEYAQPGLPGDEQTLRLEIKLIADVGLVGFPNAGKSTLLAALTRAHPKIAHYPFTTLTPNLGVSYVDAGASFVVADIPGLIEGAHTGAGLGLEFLRHIERTRILAFTLDMDERYTYEDFTILKNEIERYSAKILEKDAVVIFNKTDLVDEATVAEIIALFRASLTPEERKRVKGVYAISAGLGEGVRALGNALYALVERYKKESYKTISANKEAPEDIDGDF